MPPDGKALALFSMQSLDNFKFETSSRLFKLYIRIIVISNIKCRDEQVDIFHRGVVWQHAGTAGKKMLSGHWRWGGGGGGLT